MDIDREEDSLTHKEEICPNMKKNLKIGLILPIFMGIILYFILRKYGVNELWLTLKTVDIKWLLLGIVSIFCFFIGEGLNIGLVLRALGHKIGFLDMIKYAFAGFFFSSITPSATGGQPVQLYYMSKDGISIAHGSLALIIQLTVFQIVGIAIGTLGMLISVSKGLIGDSQIMTAFGLGIGINLVVLTLLLIGIFSQNLSKKIFNFGLNIIIKLFFRKNKDKQNSLREKLNKSLDEYAEASVIIRNNPKLIIKLLMVAMIQLLLYHAIVFFIYRALGLAEISGWQILIMQGMLYVSVSVLPLPGAEGATEAGFALIFSQIFPPTLMGSGIILSRGINFILPLIISGLALLGFNKKSDIIVDKIDSVVE